jgi:sugar-specific transcriptional regulator TrmB
MADNTDKIGETQLTTHLKSFGLTPLEADIYLCLSNTTSMTALELSRALLVPRTSIYDHIDRLIERGLVERILLYKSQQFRAFPLTILESDIIKRKQNISQLEQELQYLQTHIKQDLFTSTKTEARYYHGSTGIRQMMWHALSATKEHIGYSILGRKEIVGAKFIQEYLDEFKRRHLIDRVIINPTKESTGYVTTTLNTNIPVSFEKVRMIEIDKIKITGDTTIYNNIFSVMYWKQGEIVGVEIENPELVAMQKDMFEIIWNIAKPFTRLEK